MEIHRLRKYVTPTVIETYHNDICLIKSERKKGYWFLYDNEKAGILRNKNVLTFDLLEGKEIANIMGSIISEEFEKEMLEILEIFKIMKRGGERRWIL